MHCPKYALQMLSTLLALSHAASKLELLGCALHKTEAEVAACVVLFEERRSFVPRSEPIENNNLSDKTGGFPPT